MTKIHLEKICLAIGLTAKIAALAALMQISVLGGAQAQTQAQQACDPYEVRVTTTPAQTQRPVSLKRYDYIEQHFPKSADIVVFGDSLAERWPDKNIQNLFPGKTIANLGVNGDTTQWALWRLNSPLMQQISPQTVLLFLGTNNLRGTRPCAIAAGIRASIEKIHALWPDATIYTLTIAPRGPLFQDSEEDRLSVNAILDTLPSQYSFVKIVTGYDDVIACNSRGLTFSQQVLPSYFPDTCENYKPDNLHFSEQGYAVLGDFVKKAMQ